MTQIHNDQALREAVQTLAPDRQRLLGGRFAQRVAHLGKDERVKRAIDTALREGVGAGELEDAFKAAKGHAIKTYTQCGKDTDWPAQADHFVAAAAAAALTPEATPEATPTGLKTERQNPAWRAAVQARMASNCALMEGDDVAAQTEAERQYAIANAFFAQGSSGT
ncbi:hypothetical protein [uncultured Thiodictyon sp.]|uniref:hypothetical protein n=1 Tax=uncultured Thiodictyon sp. TaxID=1846217 RepID=UPI0025D257D5|nr:hypothetical protein [uncultured Thiodictyon sp.]